VKLTLRGEEMVYDVKEEKLRIGNRALELAPLNGRLVLRALLDRTSIELFGNRGAVTHSRVFFPNPSDKNNSLTVQGGAAHVQRLVVRELRSIWPVP
jgi:sucrose-6-phosphate hydrolase SacC (GH32 family)